MRLLRKIGNKINYLNKHYSYALVLCFHEHASYVGKYWYLLIIRSECEVNICPQ